MDIKGRTEVFRGFPSSKFREGTQVRRPPLPFKSFPNSLLISSPAVSCYTAENLLGCLDWIHLTQDMGQ